MKQYIDTIIIVALIIISFTILTFIFNHISDMNINNTRNFEYENYCDSIWITNPNYYLDSLAETDEYIQYIEEHGEWWKY